jgi:hypothetical protein
MFYLFDTQARHDVVKNYATKIRKDPAARGKFAQPMAPENFLSKVSHATSNPKRKNKVTREVLRIGMPVLSFGTNMLLQGHSQISLACPEPLHNIGDMDLGQFCTL